MLPIYYRKPLFLVLPILLQEAPLPWYSILCSKHVVLSFSYGMYTCVSLNVHVWLWTRVPWCECKGRMKTLGIGPCILL